MMDGRLLYQTFDIVIIIVFIKPNMYRAYQYYTL